MAYIHYTEIGKICKFWYRFFQQALQYKDFIKVVKASPVTKPQR